jgi:hypothetical protein
MMNTLYTIEVSKYGKLYAPYVEDMIRMLCIHSVMFLMYMMRENTSMTFGMIAESVLYILLGISLYWLVVKNIISFE